MPAVSHIEEAEKTIVVVDLSHYSAISRHLEKQLGEQATRNLNIQIQERITSALNAVVLSTDNIPIKSTGDGAIIAFDTAAQASHFAETLHLAAGEYNLGRRDEDLAQRHFRVGIWTGSITIDRQTDEGGQVGYELAGTAINYATRLQAACRTGEVLISPDTWADLPKIKRRIYGDQEEVLGKPHDKILRAHRRKISDPAPWDAKWSLKSVVWENVASAVIKLNCHLATLNPWMIICTLTMTVAILSFVWPRHRARPILFDKVRGAVFNSWNHREQSKYIEAYGDRKNSQDWVVEDGGYTGSFTYEVNPDLQPSDGASSGGYITFYGEPCDRLSYRYISFRCKAISEKGSNADVGVRIVVDNPKAAGDRELATYEIKSLASTGNIGSNWKEYKLSLSDFERSRYEPPFPDGLDANTINKIVFFIDKEIATKCPKATLWFSNISFQ